MADVDEINLFHLNLADGNPVIVDRIWNYSVDEYHAYLNANRQRAKQIQAQMDAAKNGKPSAVVDDYSS